MLSVLLCLVYSVSVCLSEPMYGSLLRAWQCFFFSAERLSVLHTSISHALISEDGQHLRSWQKDTFQRKMFCGFRESHNLKQEFGRAQKPWIKKLKKVKMGFKHSTVHSGHAPHLRVTDIQSSEMEKA